MTYPIKHVANCFLQKDFADGKATITPMKMQKLIYFLHGWHLAIHREPVIDDLFQAWQYGPVEENLYHILKNYGGSPINQFIPEWGSDWTESFLVSPSEKNFYDVFNKVYERYMTYDALQLSAMTHQVGTPWYQARIDKNPIIKNEIIERYFLDLNNDEQWIRN